MLREQCNWGEKDSRPDTARVVWIGRKRPVAVERVLIEELSAEELGAAVIVLAWLDDERDIGPADLAERIGCTQERAVEIFTRLHDMGAIFWGIGPDRPDPRIPVQREPEPAPRPKPLRDKERPPEWSGTWPHPRTADLPARRENVAYVLYRDNRVLYVGSTDSLRTRLKAHASGGRRFDRWAAYLCADRKGAYAFEHHLNLTLRPEDNPGSDHLAFTAYQQAVRA